MSLRSTRIGLVVVFLLYGVAVSTWVSRLPLFKAEIGLSTGQLSLALLGAPAGLLLAMRVVAQLVQRWSSARVARISVVLVGLSLLLPALAWSLLSFLAGLVVLGASLGALDTAMNTQGVALQRRYGRSLMSGLHGMYSVGALSGAAAGALMAELDVVPLAHFAGAGAVIVGCGLPATGRLLGREADVPNAEGEPEATAAAGRLRLLRQPYLILVGAIAYCAFFAEGSVDDWSGVYLHEVQGASLGFAPLGIAAFGVGMAVGRFLGDPVIARLGARTVLRRGAVVSAAGMTVAVLAPSPGIALAGYAVVGVGSAPLVPIVFSLAGDATGVPPAWGIARVTTLGYGGLLSSPPIVGFVAQGTGLGTALLLPAVLLASILPLMALGRRLSGRVGPGVHREPDAVEAA